MGGRSNPGEEAGKALWVWSAIRVFPVGGGAPVLANPVLQSSGAPTSDPAFSGAEVGLQVESHSFLQMINGSRFKALLQEATSCTAEVAMVGGRLGEELQREQLRA